ncbi:hypothetical protein SAMN04487907_102259 [Zunongwangia mangrovi]|uniref:Lipoprotein n=1 Tax=Zunongwangia mangrovi TaxID=1334022 RepID=A0A1I1GN43_9FLAO|nr:hypothetical protein [Zunongwangia mangrovi]SFC10540.1 hypothetical protein SAMN04487907_102259 [Zunongwangia mangrovi]
MRKLLLVFILGSLLSCGRSSTDFSPKINWKVGETKNLTISVYAKEIHNSKILKDSTFTLHASIVVNEVKNDSYFVDFELKNPLVLLAKNYDKKIESKLKDFKTIKAKLKLGKQSLESCLVSEVQYTSSIVASKKVIIEMLNINTPEKLAEAEKAISSTEEELIKTKMILQIPDLLLKSYTINYSVQDTITTIDTTANPFDLEQFKQATRKTYVQNGKNETFTVVSETKYDFGAYKKQIENLKNKMLTEVAKDSTEKQVAQTTNLADAYFTNLAMVYDLDASDKIEIARSKSDNWPKHIVRYSMLSMENSDLNSKAIVKININIE